PGTPNARCKPGRCSKIALRLNDSSEAYPLVGKRAGRELAGPLQTIPTRLDRPNIRLVFIDVIRNGHCGSPLSWAGLSVCLAQLIHALFHLLLKRLARRGRPLGCARATLFAL